MGGEFSTRVETILGGWRLTGTSEGLTRVTLEGSLPDPAAAPAPPPHEGWLPKTAERVRAHLAGSPVGYDDLPLAPAAGAFEARIREALGGVGWGETITYGELATRAGVPGGARAVGGVMARNPLPLVVPCHRVIPTGGGLGGFSAPGGTATKFQLLHLEGAWPAPPAPGSLTSLGEPLVAEAAHHWLARFEPRLAPCLERSGIWRPTARFTGHPFAALAQAVVFQQLAGAAAGAIFRRVQTLFGCAGDEFPSPDAVASRSPGDMNRAGLSAAKAGTILALAGRTGSGGDLSQEFLETGPWEAVAEALLAVRGVGPWTVEMFGIFHRRHPDILPVGDLGVRRAAGRIFGDGRDMAPDRLARLGRRWRPFRSVVAWHLWHSEGAVTM
ncbi:MAG: methylated-DNA--[protein]-cysteine S-methyltransferase [Pseudomonadota bacterium]